jgi:hypothetical protein
MKWIITNKQDFKPIDITIKIESKEELDEFTRAISNTSGIIPVEFFNDLDHINGSSK